MVSVATIVLSLVLIVLLVKSFQKDNDTKLSEIKEKLIRVDYRAQNIDFFTDVNESYTLGKKEVYMCIKDKHGKYYHDDVLMYIALHELAHALIPEDTSTHPPKFDTLFNQLKERAQYLRLYNPETPFPKEYCGKILSYY